jgi:hypothetical protein
MEVIEHLSGLEAGEGPGEGGRRGMAFLYASLYGYLVNVLG